MVGEMDTNYITSGYGILKILEFISLTIAWACLVDYFGGTSWLGSRNNFFLGVCIAAWIFVIVWFLCYLFLLCNKVNLSNRTLIYCIIHAIWFMLLLISGALVADLAASRNRKWCKWARCEIYDVAAAFGLVSALLFLIDAIYHFQNRHHAVGSSSGGRRVVATKRTVVTTTTTKAGKR